MFSIMFVIVFSILVKVLYRKKICRIVFLVRFMVCRMLILWFLFLISMISFEVMFIEVISIRIDRMMNIMLFFIFKVVRNDFEVLCYV